MKRCGGFSLLEWLIFLAILLFGFYPWVLLAHHLHKL